MYFLISKGKKKKIKTQAYQVRANSTRRGLRHERLHHPSFSILRVLYIDLF